MAVEFIKQERGDQPFMLYLSHKAFASTIYASASA
jgi:hypothetical protein